MPIINEQTGRALLRERFSAAGLNIQEDFPFCEGGVSFSIDGYDPAARIGYEYITTEAGDRAELTPEVLSGLEALLHEGRVQVLLVDELDISDAEGLGRAAERFLAEARRRSAS